MKKIVLILLPVIFCSIFCRAQQAPPGWLWLDGSGGQSYQYGGGVGTDDSGFHYISGRFESTITFQGKSGPVSITQNGNVTPFVGKFDENGNCLWLSQEPFGWDYPRGFCTDRALNNNEYVTGNLNSGDGMFVYKFDNLGNLKWAKTLGTSSFYGYGGSPNGDGVAADTAGDVYVTGETGDGSWTFGDSTLSNGSAGTTWPQNQEMFLTKMDNSENFLWAVGAEDANGAASYDVGRDVVLDKTAQYVFVCGGYQNTPLFHSKYSTGNITAPTAQGGSSSFFVAKYDTAGNLLFVATATNAGIPWSNGFNSGVGAVNAVAVDSCDDIFVTGYYTGTAQFGPILSLTETNSGGQPDGFVASCNSTGQWQWVEDIGSGISNAGDYGQTIALDKDNDVYVGGVINGTANFGNGVSLTASSTQGSLFLAKYANSNGAVQWAQGPAGSSSTGVSGLAIDTQKFVYIAGSFNGTMTLGSTTILATTNEGNIFIAKLDTVPALYIVPIVSTNYCAGETATLSYTITGTFNSGNVFTAELSDSSGSFIDDSIIGSVSSTTGGTITITIPAGIPAGSTYLIRIVSSNPATSSYVNGCGAYYQANVYIDNFYVTIGAGGKISNPVITPLDTTICPGTSINLTASGGSSYIWNNGDTGSVITVNPIIDSFYIVTVSSGCGTASDTARVFIDSVVQSLVVLPQGPVSCSGLSDTLYVSGGGSSFTWSPSSGLSATIGDTVVATPTATTTYTVTGTSSGGCPGTGTDIVTIVPSPNKPTFYQHGDTLISSAQFDNQWYYDGNLLGNDTSQDLIITKTGEYWVNVSNEANGCSTTSDSILIDTVEGIAQITLRNDVHIYPNPFNNNVFIQINSSAQNVKDWNLQIADVLGRTVYSQSSLNYTNDIDFSNLAGGVYFITIINNTARAVFPVVKQN